MKQQTAGRAGITVDQVAAVAEAQVAAGERPTLRSVRAVLGTGSMGTLTRHLAAWQSGRRQMVAEAATLPIDMQRVLLDAIEREVAGARATLEADLVATKADRDLLAEEAEQQAAALDAQGVRLGEAEIMVQQQAGRIEQLAADLVSRDQVGEQERAAAEAARQALARAELRLEGLPKIEAEVERLRVALDAAQARAVAGEKQAAVAAEKVAGLEARVRDLAERSKEDAENARRSEQNERRSSQEVDAATYRAHQLEMQVQALVGELKDATTKTAAAEAAATAAATEAADLRAQIKVAAGEEVRK
jgi:hypothetical protein